MFRLQVAAFTALALGACAPASLASRDPILPASPSSPKWSPMRVANVERLAADGFVVARALPEGREIRVRPVREIAGRLMALKALFLRTVLPEEALPDDLLAAYMHRSGLLEFLASDERAIWTTPRADVGRLHGDTIGWKLENVWALAWALGHDIELSYSGGMVSFEQIDPIFRRFTPSFAEGTLDDFVGGVEVRPTPELVSMEDLFYCAHNAVRSAQLGGNTVPPGFHPVGDGGTVHERRHALTWIISAGVSWDDTDLST